MTSRARNPGRGGGYKLKDCDRCGFTYHERDLHTEKTGWRVCRDCLDEPHPNDNRGV